MDQKLVMELLNPIRIKIIQLTLQKGETTSKELSELLPDIAIASLYRHIKRLIELEVLEILSETKIRGTIERRLKLKYNPFIALHEETEHADADSLFQIFYYFLMSQLAGFNEYLSSDYDMVKDLVGFRTYPLSLSDEECQNFVTELSDVLMKYASMEPNSQRKLRNFSFSFMPIRD